MPSRRITEGASSPRSGEARAVAYVGGAATIDDAGFRPHLERLLGERLGPRPEALTLAAPGADSTLMGFALASVLGADPAACVVELAAGDALRATDPEGLVGAIEGVVRRLLAAGVEVVLLGTAGPAATEASRAAAAIDVHRAVADHYRVPWVDARAPGEPERVAHAVLVELLTVLGRSPRRSLPEPLTEEALREPQLVPIDAGLMTESPEGGAAGHLRFLVRSVLLAAGDALAWSSDQDIAGVLLVAAEGGEVEVVTNVGVSRHPVGGAGITAGQPLAVLFPRARRQRHRARVRLVDDPDVGGAPPGRLGAIGWLLRG